MSDLNYAVVGLLIKVAEISVFPSIPATSIFKAWVNYLTTNFLTTVPFPSTVMRSV